MRTAMKTTTRFNRTGSWLTAGMLLPPDEQRAQLARNVRLLADRWAGDLPRVAYATMLSLPEVEAILAADPDCSNED
jgi:hypothetical protein